MSENDSKFASEILPFQSFDLGDFVVRTIQNDPTLQSSTKHQYIKAIKNYLATGDNLADPQALTEYALCGQFNALFPGRSRDAYGPGDGAAGQGKRQARQY
jgi:hypothetical protein